jgi:SAM-dependent methyltransferase
MSPLDLVAENLLQRASETDPFTDERYRQFLRWLPPRATDVLDVGCNTGRGGVVLRQARPALRLVALDLVQQRLDRLPAGVYDEVICGSATAIARPDQSLHAIVAGEFIEHLQPREAASFVHEAFRVLAIGGVLLLTTPNPGDVKRRLRGGTVLGGAHVSQHHPRALRLQLQMAGFGAVVLRGSGKVSRWLGTRVPLPIYGSYLAAAVKH